MLSDNHLLLRALKLNAIFSGFSALFMFATGPWLATQLGLGGALPVYFTAGLLLVFAAQLANIVRTREIRHWEIVSIIAGDLAWVIGSVVLVALFYDSISGAGLVLVDFVALAVLAFAIMQIRGLRALSPAT